MKITPQRRGFTFIELLVALTLFSVGMMSVLRIFPLNKKLLRTTAANTQAAFLAQEQVELIKSLPYTALTTGTYIARSQISTDTTSPLSLYEREVTVAYLNNARNTTNTDFGLKQVTITIYWKNEPVNQQYSVITYVFSDDNAYDSNANAI
jgi:prepilin-type N-terminal cleavage/methylation domain-containing protein